MTSAYFWSFLTPLPLCQRLSDFEHPLSNDVRPEHILPFCKQKTTKNNVGQNLALLGDKFKGWVFLFIYLLQLQQNILFFCWHHHWSNPPSPHVRFCQHFTNPPSPLRVLTSFVKAPLLNKIKVQHFGFTSSLLNKINIQYRHKDFPTNTIG